MQYKCRVCQRNFEYNADQGYDKEVCSPFCDGVESGRRSAARTKTALVAILDEMVECRELETKNYLQVLLRVRDAVEHTFHDHAKIPLGSESVSDI